MDTQDLIAEIEKLPFDEQKKLFDALSRSINQAPAPNQPTSEDEIDELLFEKGIIGNLPDLSNDIDEAEEFDPIEVEGKPLSETIIEDRR